MWQLVPTIWRLHSATWRLCKFCGKRGHLAAVCRSKSKKPHYPASQICQDVEPDDQATVLTIPNFRTLPIEPRLKLVDEDVIMEVDTAASVSLMPVEQWRSLQLPNPMEPTKCVLRTYTGEVIPTHSKVLVEVEHMNQKKTIRVPLLIVGGTGPALLGRDWLNDIQFDWHNIHALSQLRSVATLITRHPSKT